MATITLANFLKKLDILVDDYFASTTTSAGNAGGTTLIDSSLSKYPDNYFGDPERDPQYWIYSGTTLRSIKEFVSQTGTIVLHTAFGSQIGSSTAYYILRFDRDKKILACNQALYECYPDFYKEITDATTLDGTGKGTNKYTVPNTFIEFPDQIWAIDDATTRVLREQITDYEMEKISGTWYIYADITTGDDILLVGKTYLSQFTVATDSSTTELSDGQANTVAYLAASIFYRNLSNTVSSDNAGRFDALADRFKYLYEENANRNRMPRVFSLKQDFAWTGEKQGRVWPQPT